MAVINYKASPTGVLFHRSNAFVKGIMGPFGCLAGETEVITEYGPMPIEDITRPMRVLSWCEKSNQFVFSLSGGAFPKGRDYLYRVTTQRGEFVAAGHHRMLCADGSYQPVDTLCQGQSVSLCSRNLEGTKGEAYLKSLLSGASHYSQKFLDFLDDYAESARQYGQLLLSGGDTVPLSPPSLDDALLSASGSDWNAVAHKGGSEVQIQEHSHRGLSVCHTPTGGCAAQLVPHEAVKVTHASDKPFLHTLPKVLQHLLFLPMSLSRQLIQLFSSYFYSYTSSISEGAIISIERLEDKEIFWDMQIVDTNNYVTVDGTIHHNSGKSVTTCFDIWMRIRNQHPSTDGIRRSRWIIARNTFNELETTTIETWRDWFPENVFGAISRKPPYRQKIKYEDVEAEIIFLALDKPEDQKKLLSFEVTGIWFNEARQIPVELINAALGRVGRYPARKDKPEEIPAENWPTWSGILLDSNPPDDEHWYYKAAEEDSWAVNEFGEKVDPKTIPERMRWEFFSQPSGLADNAENIDNLPGGTDYYKRMLSAGESKEWIDVHVHGKYGFIKHGMPVFEGYWNSELMTARTPVPVAPGGNVYVGVDASGRHPAAVFLQKTSLGQYQAVHEIAITDDAGLGAVAFAKLLKQEMETVFPNHMFHIWGDPAGDWKSQNDERTYFEILRAEGIFIKGSPGLRIPDRLETVKSVLGRLVDAKPALLISPSCKILLRGFNGGYKYRRISTSDNSRYDDKPEKNRYSDIQDALQYVLCGCGEMAKMKGKNNRHSGKPIIANTDFAIL